MSESLILNFFQNARAQMPTGGIKGGPGDSLPPTKTVKISTVCVQPVVKNVINPIKSFLDIAVNLGLFILYKPCISHYSENFLPQKIHENSIAVSRYILTILAHF